MKSNIVFGVFCLAITSCAAEKVNESPITDVIFKAPQASVIDELNSRSTNNINAAEITNLIGSFPKVKNDAANAEVLKLKSSLKQYIFALDSYNLVERKKAFKAFERSYKKVQNLRKFLNSDDDATINRYLVRLKTNIGVIESTFDDTSISTVK